MTGLFDFQVASSFNALRFSSFCFVSLRWVAAGNLGDCTFYATRITLVFSALAVSFDAKKSGSYVRIAVQSATVLAFTERPFSFQITFLVSVTSNSL